MKTWITPEEAIASIREGRGRGVKIAILDSGELVGKKIGSTWRIKRSALDEYLAK